MLVRSGCRFLLGVALASGATASLAQPARIAVLVPGSEKTYGAIVDALREGMRENGMSEGRDYVLDVRWAEGRYERFPAMVADVMRLKPRVIVPGTIAAVRAAQEATSSLPIVMPSINDPVGAKLVASLARPGGNTTGVATLADDVTPKLIDLMREIAPQVQQAAMIVNPDNSSNYKHLESARTAAGRVGVRIDGFELRNMGQLEAVFAAMQSRGVRAVLVARDAALLDLRAELCALAVKHRMPLIGPQPEYGEAGALVGYGASARDNYRRAAVYIKRILAGAKPADLPVEQPQRVVLTVNARTAKALGIAVPGTVLVRADHVVQ